jgi:hypothetical protein
MYSSNADFIMAEEKAENSESFFAITPLDIKQCFLIYVKAHYKVIYRGRG